MNDIQHADDDALYGDLGTTSTPFVSTSSSSHQQPPIPTKQEQEPKVKQLKPSDILIDQKEVQDLRNKIADLTNENETLKRNMGILYRTAKLELERKDARIRLLEEQG